MKRILIKKLSLSGENKEPSFLVFKKGLNVISGDSDTGKTYAFQCLDYMLGKEKPPKEIVEAQGYSLITLEFSVDEDDYVLQRKIGDNQLLLLHNGATQSLNYKHNKNNNRNLSQFLLNLLSGKENKIFIIKNENNITRTLSFRDLAHLCLVSETDIIAESSAFQSIQYTEKTARRSILKYIITGIDDSDYNQESNDENEEIKRVGVIDYLTTKKSELEQRIIEIETNTQFKLFKDNSVFNDSIRMIQNTRDELALNQEKLSTKNKSIRELSEICAEDEAKIVQFKDLLNHYNDEFNQYNMIKTYEEFVSQLPKMSCPFCHQAINPKALEGEETKDLYSFWQARLTELQGKKTDLLKSINDIQDRLKENLKKLQKETKDCDLLRQEGVLLEQKLSALSEAIAETRRLEALDNTFIILKDELEKIIEKIDDYTNKPKQIKATRRNIDQDNYRDYCDTVSKLLTNWGYKKNIQVTFDPDKLDLSINGKTRDTLGKGYRAFVMAAMAIGLMRYCREKDLLHPGFVVIDSPLVSLKERKKDENGQWADSYMEEKMIKDILERDSQNQVIIFENKDLRFNYNYNYIEFRHDGDIKGFIK